jgi:signal peptide peptidase SppA
MPQLNYPHIAEMVFNTPLLAKGELVENVAQYVAARIAGTEKSTQNSEQELSAKRMGVIPLGDPEKDGSMAVIAVHGILVPRRGTMTAECSEIMSFELLRNQISKAMNDSQIKEIVLDIQSGGGTAQAAFECAAYIYEAQKQKPIRAVINFNAYSAAYLIASACTEIIISETGGVGSIGVYQKRLDISAYYKDMGVIMHTFYRGAKKVFMHPDLEMSDEEKEHIESGIEKTYQQFVNAVAKYRNMSVDEVQATEADCFNGQEAIDLKLADTLSSDPHAAVNAIAKRLIQSSPKKMETIGVQAAAMDYHHIN